MTQNTDRAANYQALAHTPAKYVPARLGELRVDTTAPADAGRRDYNPSSSSPGRIRAEHSDNASYTQAKNTNTARTHTHQKKKGFSLFAAATLYLLQLGRNRRRFSSSPARHPPHQQTTNVIPICKKKTTQSTLSATHTDRRHQQRQTTRTAKGSHVGFRTSGHEVARTSTGTPPSRGLRFSCKIANSNVRRKSKIAHKGRILRRDLSPLYLPLFEHLHTHPSPVRESNRKQHTCTEKTLPFRPFRIRKLFS